METHTRIAGARRHIGLLAALATINLAGCVWVPDHARDSDRDHSTVREQYRYENGDRVDREGHREVGWCNQHRDDEHCH